MPERCGVWRELRFAWAPFRAGAVSPAFPPHSVRNRAAGELRLELEVERLRPREGFETESRQRAAAPGILDTGPGERRIEVVAAIHEPSARLDALADAQGRLRVRRPDRRREAVAAVIHALDCLLVALDRHDPGHRPEDFLGDHLLPDVDQHLR